jgi:hypothetical protein
VSPIGTKRFTNRYCGPAGSFTVNVDGTSQAWTQLDFVPGGVKQGKNGPLDVTWVACANLDNTFTNWVNTAGMRSLKFTPTFLWEARLNTDLSLKAAWQIYEGEIDACELWPIARLTLRPGNAGWSRPAPFLTMADIGAGAILPDPTDVILW